MKRAPILLILLTLNSFLSIITYGADRRGFNKKKLAKVGDKVQSLIDEKFIAGAPWRQPASQRDYQEAKMMENDNPKHHYVGFYRN